MSAETDDTTERARRDAAPPNDGPVGAPPGSSAEADRGAPTGLPDDAEETTPLGTTEEDPEGEAQPRRGEDHMPGIPTGGEPPSAG